MIEFSVLFILGNFIVDIRHKKSLSLIENSYTNIYQVNIMINIAMRRVDSLKPLRKLYIANHVPSVGHHVTHPFLTALELYM